MAEAKQLAAAAALIFSLAPHDLVMTANAQLYYTAATLIGQGSGFDRADIHRVSGTRRQAINPPHQALPLLAMRSGLAMQLETEQVANLVWNHLMGEGVQVLLQ